MRNKHAGACSKCTAVASLITAAITIDSAFSLLPWTNKWSVFPSNFHAFPFLYFTLIYFSSPNSFLGTIKIVSDWSSCIYTSRKKRKRKIYRLWAGLLLSPRIFPKIRSRLKYNNSMHMDSKFISIQLSRTTSYLSKTRLLTPSTEHTFVERKSKAVWRTLWIPANYSTPTPPPWIANILNKPTI